MSTRKATGVPTTGNLESRMYLHKLDPRAKTLACLFAVMGLGGGPNWAFSGWLLAFAGLAASGLAPGRILKTLTPVFLLCLLGVSLHGLAVPGTPIHPLVPLSAEGLFLGAKLASQLLAAAALAGLLAATTPAAQIAASLSWMFRPLGRTGIPVEEFFTQVALALSLVPALREEYEGQRSSAAERVGLKATLRAAFAVGFFRRLLARAEIAAGECAAADGSRVFRPFRVGEWLAVAVSLAAGPFMLVVS